MRFAVSHPSRKNNDAARVGHAELELRVDGAELDGFCHASDAENIRGNTHGEFPLDVKLQHVAKGCFHHAFQTIIDILRFPEQVLLILHPFKVGDRDATGIAQNVRNDEDPLGFEDSVCCRG